MVRTTGGNNPGAVDDKTRKLIGSIKEIVASHSDADIYAALSEANMNPDDAAQKLLNQDPFREVKRKRERKKEDSTFKGSVDERKPSDNGDNGGHGMKFRTLPDRNFQQGGYPRNSVARNSITRNSVARNSVSWNPVARNSIAWNPVARNSVPGTNREFRVVRDNRSNLNANQELKQSNNEKLAADVTEKGSTGTSSGHRSSAARTSVNASNVPTDSRFRQTGDAPSGGSNNVVGVYSSSTDPVHVPSSATGAIKREVGAVGVGRQPAEKVVKDSSASNESVSNSILRKDSSAKSYRPFSPMTKVDQLSQTTVPESVIHSTSASRSFLGSQYGNRSGQFGNRTQQQAGGHQKAPQHNKEWKPKSIPKSSVKDPGVIGTPKKSSPPPDNHTESEAAKLQRKFSLVNITENQNVIIAEHIRVPDNDRCQLTFGSFGAEIDSSGNSIAGIQEVGISEEANVESAQSVSITALEPSSDGAAGARPAGILDDQVRRSGSHSPMSNTSEQQLPEQKDGSRAQNSDDYADIGLLRGSSPSYPSSESKQQQDPPELQNFSAYDPQTGYDLPYFRPATGESVRGQGLPSPQEALSSHTANSIPASSLAMLQQQQAPMAQMYPQVHVSHFANLMPYRQFLSPVYVPQMPMPGYSGNPAYPHPSNGNNYLLMPGGSSHLSANGLKYGIQQFKPVPTGNATGFGNFSNPAGYPINSPGVVGNASGLEDSSRMKYKDGSIYVPNPQAETSEMWIQNPRELPGLQSAPYYNMAGQTPHAAYLPSHTGHASFNAAAAQSSHMQFQGLFHPPQAAMANPHHLGPAMGGNVGVGVAPPTPAAQVGTYQQPQLGHLNWPTNF